MARTRTKNPYLFSLLFSKPKKRGRPKKLKTQLRGKYLSIFSTLKSSVVYAKEIFSFSLHLVRTTILPPTQKKRGRKKKDLATSLPLWKKFVIGTSMVLIGAACLFLLTLPHPSLLKTRPIAQTSFLYDRYGTLLYEFYATENRTIVPLKKIPKHVINATFAIEDKHYYSHPGFDISAIIRAGISNMQGGLFQGGSTLTQQLVKSALLTPEKKVLRKVKEVILAFWTEQLYSKDEILTMYFNQIPYGGTAWGIEAAANIYFGKHVEDLTLPEGAFLAGITAAPSYYSPFGNHPLLWKERQKEVLGKMKDLSYITDSEYQKALTSPLEFKKPQTALNAPHFIAYIKDYLVSKYGLSAVEKGGLRIKTTLDLSLQQKTEEIVRRIVDDSWYLWVSNGAVVVTDPNNGDILAMVGSKDYASPNGGTVNLAVSKRQPGSSIKVVTYAAALGKGLTSASLIDDSPITYNIPGSSSYTPVNYDGRFHGRLPLRYALGNSYNIPAVKTLEQIGIPSMINLGKDMGITSWGEPDEYGLAVTLGSAEVTMLDLATVFGTLANEGERVTPEPITEIKDSSDRIVVKKEVDKKQVLDPGVSYIMSDILSDNGARVMAFGASSPLVIPGYTVSVKTGTSDNKRDNWTVGYTQDYVVTVWVGNNDGSPMNPSLASGITGAAPIWHEVMQHLLSNTPDHKPSLPSTVVSMYCGGRQEYFLKGTEPRGCQGYPMTAGSQVGNQRQ